MGHTHHILLFSRDPDVVQAIQNTSITSEFRVTVCGTTEETCARLQQNPFPVLLVHLPAGEDEEHVLPLLWAVSGARRACATVVLAAALAPDAADRLLRAGVADCLDWPTSLFMLPGVLQELTSLALVDPSPGARDGSPSPEEDLFDEAQANMVRLMEQVKRVAGQEATLLLTGETGTGKTRLARLIHQLSPRRLEPFLVVDCGVLAAGLIESELFGHAKGAFTGADRDRVGKLASAGTGTLLLDEINSLPLESQGKLLRAVDERAFEPLGSGRTQQLRARLVAASNKPLEEEVEAGRFRADLYYRLNVVSFYLPPLRDRRISVVPLATRFLREIARRDRPGVVGFSSQAQRLLQEYDWPGNIRELRNAISGAVALCDGSLIDVGDLPAAVQRAWRSPSNGEPASPVTAPATNGQRGSATLASNTQEVEVRLIREALRKHNNNRLRAAAELGISRAALYKKLGKYGLMTPRYFKGK